MNEEQKEYEAYLNVTEKAEAIRMQEETRREQPYQDETLNFIYPFFEEIDEFNPDVWDWLQHIKDECDETRQEVTA